MPREEKAALAKTIGAETGMDYKGIVRYSRWGTELEQPSIRGRGRSLCSCRASGPNWAGMACRSSRRRFCCWDSGRAVFV